MKISEVAERVDLSISTIRYYEKMGMIPDEYVRRDQNNYRNYEVGIVRHLNVVKNCLAVGFSIHDVKLMVAKNEFTKAEQIEVIQAKIAEIEGAQRKLEESKQNLREVLDKNIVCEGGFGKYDEPVV